MKKNPWQDSSGRERDLHEDLAELLKKLPKGGSAIVYLPVLLIVLWAVFSSFYTVQPE